MNTPAPLVTQIVNLAFQILAPLVLLLGGYLIHRAAAWFSAKTSIAISSGQEDLVNEWVSAGISFAEEKARQAAKKGDSAMTGHEKLEAAAGFVFDMVQRAGWVDWTRDHLKAKIDAAVGAGRAPAAPVVMAVATGTTVGQ